MILGGRAPESFQKTGSNREAGTWARDV